MLPARKPEEPNESNTPKPRDHPGSSSTSSTDAPDTDTPIPERRPPHPPPVTQHNNPPAVSRKFFKVVGNSETPWQP